MLRATASSTSSLLYTAPRAFRNSARTSSAQVTSSKMTVRRTFSSSGQFGSISGVRWNSSPKGFSGSAQVVQKL